ncbi:lipopolysaccharide biosynthesis protein [Arenibacter sp. F26102]|uniref:lipopolysaccharide biosynthesis protein n=1 Tax=Arenibacter sp. F26102 TaxID=2926416 RepID=UPI001FF6977C|nr:lipopolysaccharide biosynthesis protein [Arenibacter sp. F26102]MCK0147051.1 lipopolysaccharide biosynthesis protein [Arenibacter sp. F26102]
MKKGNESTTKKGLIGVIWNFSGSIAQILIQLVIVGVLARLLTPQEFGIVAVMMILVTFSELFSHMGIGSALIQLPVITPKHISLAYTLSLLLGLIMGTLFYFIAPQVGLFFELKNVDNAIRFFAIFFPLGSFSSITSALLTREMRFSIIVKCNIISYVFGTGLVSIILAYFDFGFWSLILGQFAGLVLDLIIMLYYKLPTFSMRFRKEVVKDLLFFGSGHTLGTVFNYFAENADNIIIGKSFGPVTMGVYSKAFQLLAIPSKFFGSIFDKVIFPILSQKQSQKEKLTAFYLFSTSLCFGILAPASILIYINAQLIVNLLLGPQWDNVILPLKILILGLAFRFGSKINKIYLKSMGLIYRGAYYNFIFAALMFGCCYLGGLWYGMPGVAGGVFAATVLNYFQVGYRLYKNLKFSLSWYALLIIKAFILNLPFLFITLILVYFGITSMWIHFTISLILYIPVMTYLFFAKRYIIFNVQHIPIINQILQAFPKKIQKIVLRANFLNNYNE